MAAPALGLWLLLVLAGMGGGVVLHAAQQPGDLTLAITNTSDQPMEVYVGGDRVRIIRGHDIEYLDLPVAAWAWPRRIEVRRWANGERLLAFRADLEELSRNHWHLRIP